jgi:hypothetical protein
MTPSASQTAAANQARRQRTEEKLRHVADAISQLRRRRLPVTYLAVAARAGVSRTFLYDNPAAHAEIRTQRARIGELLGQLRDAREDHDPGAAERLAAENSNLKQRVRDLTAANRTLE